MGEIRRWLGVFLEQLFQFSQLKRSRLSNVPKVAFATGS